MQTMEEIDAILYEAGLEKVPNRSEKSEGSRSARFTPKRSRSGSGSSRRLGKSTSAAEAHSQQAGFSAKHGDLQLELDKNGNPILLGKHCFGPVSHLQAHLDHLGHSSEESWHDPGSGSCWWPLLPFIPLVLDSEARC